MIILLFGQDTYRSKQKLAEIIQEEQKIGKNGLNLRFYDFQKDNFEKFWDELKQSSLFQKKKLLVLKNAFAGSEFKEKFKKKSKEAEKSDDTVLFFEEGEIKKSDSFFQFLKNRGEIQEFNNLNEAELRKWLKNEFGKYRAEITSEALEKLVGFVGNNLWQMAQEIKKLLNYKKGKKIETKDVEFLVKPKFEPDIFKTIDSLAQKNKKLALSLLKKHLELGEAPLYLLSMINFQFRNILSVRELMEKGIAYQQILDQIKLHPFVIKKSYWQAQKFTLPELKKIYRKILQADFNMKTGKLNPEMALDLFVAEI